MSFVQGRPANESFCAKKTEFLETRAQQTERVRARFRRANVNNFLLLLFIFRNLYNNNNNNKHDTLLYAILRITRCCYTTVRNTTVSVLYSRVAARRQNRVCISDENAGEKFRASVGGTKRVKRRMSNDRFSKEHPLLLLRPFVGCSTPDIVVRLTSTTTTM